MTTIGLSPNMLSIVWDYLRSHILIKTILDCAACQMYYISNEGEG